MHKCLPNFFTYLDKYENKIFQNNNTNIGIIYRNYQSTNRELELTKIAKACKRKRYKLYVSNDLKLAMKVKADGIYIPSFNKSKMFSNLEQKKLLIIGSAHNQKEIKEKIRQQCQILFIAPVFYVKGKKTPLNTHKFNYLSHTNKIKFYALGGINEKN